MEKEDLRKRTKEFALKIIRLCLTLPKHPQVQIISNQLLRSGTSVGANYREGFRARSDQEFVSKLGICVQELEETGYWLELLEESGMCPKEKLAEIKDETEQLTAIFVSSIKTMKSKIK
jgi:four helix bundle protein